MKTFGENPPADYIRKYSDAALCEEVERVRLYHMDFMIGQELWILKAAIAKRKEQGEAFVAGDYCVIDTEARMPIGFSDWRDSDYDCIEEARLFCPALLLPRKFFKRVEYRPCQARVRRLLGMRTVEQCGLAARLSDDGKQYLVKLYEAARAEGIGLLMKYDWKYSCGASDAHHRTEQMEVDGGFNVESEFFARIPVAPTEVHANAVLSVTVTYRFDKDE